MKPSPEISAQSEQDCASVTRRTPTLRRNTREKILTGTLSAVAERGVSKLSMSSICQHAGVSRATLYQYFSTPEEVLAIVADQLSNDFVHGLQMAVKDCVDPWQILNLVSQYLNDHARVQSFENFMRHESQFAIESIRQHYESYVDAVQAALDPAIEAIQIEFECSLDRRLCAEFLLRNQFSAMLIPGKGQWLDLPALLPAARAWLTLRQQAST
jgi:AcrR family transcriptional regulator